MVVEKAFFFKTKSRKKEGILKKKAYPLKSLLLKYGCIIDVVTAYKALTNAGVLANCNYQSTTGSGETKSFTEIIDNFLHLGENKKSVFHEFRTAPVFYEEKIKEIIEIILLEINKSTNEILKELSNGKK